MEFVRTEQDDDGNWVEDEEETVRVKADYIISAFGSGLNNSEGKDFNKLKYNETKLLFLQIHASSKSRIHTYNHANM